MEKKRCLHIFVNADWFFLSHRLPIALEAMSKGYNVTILAFEEEGRGNKIKSYGFNFHALKGKRGGVNVFKDIGLFFQLLRIFAKNPPDILHQVTLKPIVYGTLASRFFPKIKVVNAVSGLGSNIISDNIFKRFFFKSLIRLSLLGDKVSVIFQNKSDAEFLNNLVHKDKTKQYLILGSGVNLKLFNSKTKKNNKITQIVYSGRMLGDKGLRELINACKLLNENGFKFLLTLAGKIDHENPTGISESTLEEWNKLNFVNWIGHCNNISDLLSNADIFVLPSYREGLSKSLIEAAASSLPIVTCDVPGCREVVDDGINGFLVKPKSSIDLSTKIKILLNDPDLRITMGKYGRIKAEKLFDADIVVKQHMKVYANCS